MSKLCEDWEEATALQAALGGEGYGSTAFREDGGILVVYWASYPSDWPERED